MAEITLGTIRKAASTIAGTVPHTPTVPALYLSRRLGCELYLKLENQHLTGSFKDRGTLNRIKHLTAEQASAGIIAMSAGNHAQGVAYHAEHLGIPATIVMPEDTPLTKVERTRAFGARIVLSGESLNTAGVAARALAESEGLTFIHPYDDPLVIAGQGSAGLEMIGEVADLDSLLVPIGGGGLFSGVATAAKAFNPAIKMYGVEAERYPSMYQAIYSQPPTSGGTTLAEGIAVKEPGELTRTIVERYAEEILLVSEVSLEHAIYLLVQNQGVVAEGAGAAALAALVDNPDYFKGQKVGLVVSGSNIDLRLLASILTRALFHEGRLVRLRIDITDKPGILGQVATLIGKTGGNIVEVEHQRQFYDVPVKQAEIDVVVEMRHRDHVHELMTSLERAGFHARILSSLSTNDHLITDE